MRVTSKGQVTIPRNVRDVMGIRPAETEVEFVLGENDRWYLKKTMTRKKGVSRFRTINLSSGIGAASRLTFQGYN
jgi:antitoxin PrlF